MPDKEMAAPMFGASEATQENQRTRIIPPALRLGNCIACGQRIRLIGDATRCPICSAWRRWHQARRIATAAQEV